MVEDEIRKPQEVAKRALALFGVWGLTAGAPRDDILDWLEEAGLYAELTPKEAAFVENSTASERQVVEFSWHAERLVVLLWALHVIDDLPAANAKCNVRVFHDTLPPFADESAEDFIARARLRTDDELRAQEDAIYDLRSGAADARRHKRSTRASVDIDIIHQRHFAMNWLVGYSGQNWDEVTPDI